MLLEHRGRLPTIDVTATVAPTAVVCGDVTIGPHCHIAFGAVLAAEGGPIRLGTHVVVREHALLRATAGHPLDVGDHVLIGPHASLTGCSIGDEVFVATGAVVFHGARIDRRAEVRVHGVVHVSSAVPQGATVPIGWVAVGDPARLLSPDQHDRICAVQRPLDFPRVAYGVGRGPDGSVDMRVITRRLCADGATHREDVLLEPGAA